MRLRRRPFAWLALFALLFAQLATAAYACERAVVAMTDSSEASSAVSGGRPCEAMQMDPTGDEASGPLCIDHCGGRPQATADVHAPVLHWGPVQLIVLVTTIPQVVIAEAWPRDFGKPDLHTPVAPSIPILLGRFLS